MKIPLATFFLEDDNGDISLEFVFKHARFMVFSSPDPKERGWFLVWNLGNRLIHPNGTVPKWVSDLLRWVYYRRQHDKH